MFCMTLEEAACAYVLARESGKPVTARYRALRRAWIARVRAKRLEIAPVKRKARRDGERGAE